MFVKIIHKQILQPLVETSVQLPKGAEIISAGMQGWQPTIWYLFDKDVAGMEERKFLVMGTGQPMLRTLKKFIGTCITQDGAFVWHIFEVGE